MSGRQRWLYSEVLRETQVLRGDTDASCLSLSIHSTVKGPVFRPTRLRRRQSRRSLRSSFRRLSSPSSERCVLFHLANGCRHRRWRNAAVPGGSSLSTLSHVHFLVLPHHCSFLPCHFLSPSLSSRCCCAPSCYHRMPVYTRVFIFSSRSEVAIPTADSPRPPTSLNISAPQPLQFDPDRHFSTRSTLQAQFGAADGRKCRGFTCQLPVRSSARHSAFRLPRSLFHTSQPVCGRFSKAYYLKDDRFAWLRLVRDRRRRFQAVVTVCSHPPSSLVPPIYQGKSYTHGTLDCHVAVRPRRTGLLPALCARPLRVLCPLPKDPPPPLRHRESLTRGHIG